MTAAEDEMTKPSPSTDLQRRIERYARDAGKVIGDGLPKNIGFVLLIAAMGDAEEMTYASNIHRADCVRLLREFADALEEQMDTPKS